MQCDIEDPLFVSTPRISCYSTSESELSDTLKVQKNHSIYQETFQAVYHECTCVCMYLILAQVSLIVCDTMLMLFFRSSDETLDLSDHSSTPWQKGQTLYLVFESALLLLFSSCFYCGSKHTKVNKVVLGSFLRLIQRCIHCNKRRTWDSQPHIGNIPAGNILTSAAIVYSGALPSKAL